MPAVDRGEDQRVHLAAPPVGELRWKQPQPVACWAEDRDAKAWGKRARWCDYYGPLSGKTVGIAGGHLTGWQMAEAMSKALGREVVYNAVPFDVYRGFGFPGAEDLGNMFQFKRDFEKDFCGARNPDVARSLNPKLQTFDQWLERNAARAQPFQRRADQLPAPPAACGGINDG